MRTKITVNNKFKTAVEKTTHIKNAYQNGLQALGMNSKKIVLKNACEGSVNIDKAVETIYPDSNRWDYCFSHDGEVFFVEVHPANTSDISKVIKKLMWLKAWLKNHAPEIDKLKATSQHPFYWIQTTGYHILKGSPQHRKLVENGINPVSRLSL